jgi:hypothetical protein
VAWRRTAGGMPGDSARRAAIRTPRKGALRDGQCPILPRQTINGRDRRRRPGRWEKHGRQIVRRRERANNNLWKQRKASKQAHSLPIQYHDDGGGHTPSPRVLLLIPPKRGGGGDARLPSSLFLIHPPHTLVGPPPSPADRRCHGLVLLAIHHCFATAASNRIASPLRAPSRPIHVYVIAQHAGDGDDDGILTLFSRGALLQGSPLRRLLPETDVRLAKRVRACPSPVMS